MKTSASGSPPPAEQREDEYEEDDFVVPDDASESEVASKKAPKRKLAAKKRAAPEPGQRRRRNMAVKKFVDDEAEALPPGKKLRMKKGAVIGDDNDDEEIQVAERSALVHRAGTKAHITALQTKHETLAAASGIDLRDPPVGPAFLMDPPNKRPKKVEEDEEDVVEEDPMSYFAIAKRHAHLLRACRGGAPYLRTFFYTVKETPLWGVEVSAVTEASAEKDFPDVIAKAVWKYRPANAFNADMLAPAMGREQDQTPITNMNEITAIFEEVKKDKERQEKGEPRVARVGRKPSQQEAAPRFGMEAPKKAPVQRTSSSSASPPPPPPPSTVANATTPPPPPPTT